MQTCELLPTILFKDPFFSWAHETITEGHNLEDASESRLPVGAENVSLIAVSHHGVIFIMHRSDNLKHNVDAGRCGYYKLIASSSGARGPVKYLLGTYSTLLKTKDVERKVKLGSLSDKIAWQRS